MDQGRLALDILERTLLLAGYGVHPPLAFDFSRSCGGAATSNCDASDGVQSACAAQPCLDRE